MDKELKRIIYSFFIPVLFLILLWTVKFLEVRYDTSFSHLGILPLQAEGLKGILMSPLLHGDWDHLMSNSVPLLVLGWGLFYYYRSIAFKVLIFSWLFSGFWVWVFARESYHIGASTIVYALAAFHIVSALIRRRKNLLAFMMLVFFLYGSMIWGLFPEFFPHKNISWEGHLMGSLAGIVLAVFYRREGPQREKYDWEEEEDEDENEDTEEENNPYWMVDEQNIDPRKLNVRYKYHYRPRKDKQN